MELDLVSLQQNSKQIRNPFGFDFTCDWNKRNIVLKGDGQWRSIIAPLADHIVNRLYMKVYYQYHDEQVAALKAKGDDRGARGYRVPADVENKIMMLITGKPKHSDLPVADTVNDEADLTVLKNELKAVERKAATGGLVNVSKILEKANIEALPAADSVSGKDASAHVSGGASLSDEVAIEPEAPVDTTPIDVDELKVNQAPGITEEAQAIQAQTPVEPAAETAPADGEFGELNELDNESK